MDTASSTYRIMIAAVVCVAMACSSRDAPRGEPLPQSELQQYRACQKDDDCMWVQNGCCDCANGGEDTAVARSKVTEFRARFACGGVPCTEMDREPACGTGTVSCEQGSCIFRDHAP